MFCKALCNQFLLIYRIFAKNVSFILPLFACPAEAGKGDHASGVVEGAAQPTTIFQYIVFAYLNDISSGEV